MLTKNIKNTEYMLPLPTYDIIKTAYANKGFTYFEGTTPYNLNLWGIRKQYGEIDLFDDLLGVSYLDESGQPRLYAHHATVDPGKYYLITKTGNHNGTFILAPGQYRGCWKTGNHGSSRYLALVQKPNYTGFKGWRDSILNGIIDRNLKTDGTFYTDVKGLNMHRSNTSYQSLVGRYSSGCQVRQCYGCHSIMMDIISKALHYFSNSFSYTLFEEEDVFPTSNTTTRGNNSTQKIRKWPEDFIKIHN
ncbi:MAG: hypothetical protein R2774_04990 [Saprospiraceae bacterium]